MQLKMLPMPQINDLVLTLLRRAPLYSWEDLKRNSELPPELPGVYAWFFDKVPDAIPLAGCLSRGKGHLLYVEISPGRTPSKQNLRTRILCHFRGNAEGSTLRLTLGCLLENELGAVLRRVGSGRRKTFGLREINLTAWMTEHARVSWVVTQNPKELETRLIRSVYLPLNLDENEHCIFHATLSEIRGIAKARSLSLPILPGY